MLKVDKARTFRREVKARAPVDDGTQTEKFTAVYRLIPTEDVKGYDLDSEDGTRAFLKAAVVELGDLSDAEGKSLTYSDAVLELVLSLPYARAALLREYLSAVSGVRAGN